MRILLLTGLLLLIAACGQKGDLYLPEEGADTPGKGTCSTCPPVQTEPAATPATEAGPQDASRQKARTKESGSPDVDANDTDSNDTKPQETIQ